MANKTRTRLYTRWRSTIVPGHCTNDRESYTVHQPTRPAGTIRQEHGRVEPKGETRPLKLEELEMLLSANKSFRITKQRKGK